METLLQKARNAMRALTANEPIAERIDHARWHLMHVMTEQSLRLAPPEVRVKLHAVRDIKKGTTQSEVAARVEAAIESILRANGSKEEVPHVA